MTSTAFVQCYIRYWLDDMRIRNVNETRNVNDDETIGMNLV